MMKEVEDVPELMHNIQLRLSIKEAAQTSMLSKSWLHAWSTLPTLRFYVGKGEQGRKQLNLVDRTLKRYHRDNIPIEKFDFNVIIENRKSAFVVGNCFRTLATKTCLKELSLIIDLHFFGVSFNLLDEILLAGESITMITIRATQGEHSVFLKSVSLTQSRSLSLLKELHLEGVRIIQQVLDHILSSCSLLVRIELSFCSRDLNAIKVKNLLHLYELKILTEDRGSTALEISHVPNLGSFSCHLDSSGPLPPSFFNTHSISLGISLTQLWLGGIGLITDYASLDIFKSGRLPNLKTLTLSMQRWTLERFHFICASINKFSMLSCPRWLIDVQMSAPKLLFFRFEGYTMPSLDIQMNAPKLLVFRFEGYTMPSLLFPSSITLLKEAEFRLDYRMPFDVSFFLKMREALSLSSECNINITTSAWDDDSQLDIVDDLRARLPFPPATNVQQLSFETSSDECKWDHSPFFNAFFEICRPKHVYAKPDIMLPHKNHFCNLMLNEVLGLEKTTSAYWPRCLKSVQIRRHEKWETLTNSHKIFLKRLARGPVEFELNWS